MTYTKIDWMEMEKEGYIQTLELIDEDELVQSKMVDVKLDLIIGTDVVYWRDSILPLIKTLDIFFNQHDQKITFLLCYIERHAVTHKELKQALSDYKFIIEEIGQETTSRVNEQQS